MNNTKKVKLKNLNFYTINDNYINYISDFDKHIAYNKNQTRPYVGVIIIIESYFYFAPLFSPKVKHKNYKDNLTFFKIQETKTKRYLGLIRFSDMIPVPLKCITPLLTLKIKVTVIKGLFTNSIRILMFLKTE